jgi:hypothetical protein
MRTARRLILADGHHDPAGPRPHHNSRHIKRLRILPRLNLLIERLLREVSNSGSSDAPRSVVRAATLTENIGGES